MTAEVAGQITRFDKIREAVAQEKGGETLLEKLNQQQISRQSFVVEAGEIYLQQGKFDRAAECYQKCLD